PSPVDPFHPAVIAGEPQPAPVYGGQVIVHMASLPKHMNYVTENSSYTRRMLYEVHESLLLQDWEYHDYRPRVAESYVTEDLVVLKPGLTAPSVPSSMRYEGKTRRVKVKVGRPAEEVAAARERGEVLEKELQEADAVYGRVELAGDVYRVTPVSEGGLLRAPMDVPVDHVQQIELGAVMTVKIRPGVRWQTSRVLPPDVADALADQTVDAKDVYFSWSIYWNAGVDCDEKRFQFERITDAEIVDPMTVRFFYEEQYFLVVDSIGTSLTILPAHLYDLSDPENPDHDPQASPQVQAEHINKNPHNQMWVGVGPYQVTAYTQQDVQAERFPDYYDPAEAGYVDKIRWRCIDDDSIAFQALLNGELDYFERVKSSDYFGAATQSDTFTRQFYKGYKYLGTYGYTGWNLYRPHLADPVVRRAIAHAFDFEEYKETQYKGLCNQVTGPFPYESAAYDHSVKPYPYDTGLAVELLEDAGWYDRNGDDVADKDGVELVIDFMMPSGNEASKAFGLKLQESLGEIGIKVTISQYEWATFLENLRTRQFDACNLAWVPTLESDPEQIWHSKHGAFEKRSSNNSGVREPELDRLIEAGQRELDWAKRQEIWHAMHRFIYELQPYLFMYNVPQKYAIAKRIRGFQTFAIDPGYSVRRWYLEPGSPGTRTQLALEGAGSR
ncbi:MAG TPA: ABC transporter substrate-binding protein, partial [Planctomycetota bacterium]|nr:ABC transporter substrate-binding protein [Planctomycetota bacterium]